MKAELEKKTGGAREKKLQGDGGGDTSKPSKEDIKIMNTSTSTDGNNVSPLAIPLTDGDEPDSLDMKVKFGAFVGDNFEFFKIKSSNGVVKLADDGSEFTVKSEISPTKSSNYGMSMAGHFELMGIGEILLTVTVADDMNDKLVARIGSGVTNREIFDIIYDDNSPGAFKLYNHTVEKYVASNDTNHLVADQQNEEDGQGMYRNNCEFSNNKKQRIRVRIICLRLTN